VASAARNSLRRSGATAAAKLLSVMGGSTSAPLGGTRGREADGLGVNGTTEYYRLVQKSR
jgi:hypothetical protein